MNIKEICQSIKEIQQKIEEIYQNAEVTSWSVKGNINKVRIHIDQYDFLINIVGEVNKYKEFGDEFVEMDFHDEFGTLINNAREIEENKIKEIRSECKHKNVERWNHGYHSICKDCGQSDV